MAAAITWQARAARREGGRVADSEGREGEPHQGRRSRRTGTPVCTNASPPGTGAATKKAGAFLPRPPVNLPSSNWYWRLWGGSLPNAALIIHGIPWMSTKKPFWRRARRNFDDEWGIVRIVACVKKSLHPRRVRRRGRSWRHSNSAEYRGRATGLDRRCSLSGYFLKGCDGEE